MNAGLERKDIDDRVRTHQRLVDEGRDDKSDDEDADDACSATTEWLDEHSCPNGHLGGQYGCDFCNVGVVDKSGTNNLNEFLKEQGWEKYDIKKHYNLKYKVKVESEEEENKEDFIKT